IRLLNSVKHQLELIGKHCPSLTSQISFICILKLLEELSERLEEEKAKDEMDISSIEMEKREGNITS
ncbi:unnamed protein product, partial [marine sediment metagenome]